MEEEYPNEFLTDDGWSGEVSIVEDLCAYIVENGDDAWAHLLQRVYTVVGARANLTASDVFETTSALLQPLLCRSTSGEPSALPQEGALSEKSLEEILLVFMTEHSIDEWAGVLCSTYGRVGSCLRVNHRDACYALDGRVAHVLDGARRAASREHEKGSDSESEN